MPAPDPNRHYSYSGDMMNEGQRAEAVVLDFIKSWRGVQQIADVRNDRAWQQREVDIRVKLPTRWLNLEVKSDRHITQTQNVLFELMRVHHNSQTHPAYLGWGVFSHADFVMVWCPTTALLYSFAVPTLRAAMQKYFLTRREQSRLIAISTDKQRTTINVLVPLDGIQHSKFQKVGGLWLRY